MKFALMLPLLLLFGGCGDQTGPATPANTGMSLQEALASAESSVETARLNAWFDDQNEERLTFSPIELTMLGRRTQYDEIDQMSIAAQRDYLDWFAASVAEMEAEFDYELLDFEARTSYDLWRYTFARNRAALVDELQPAYESVGAWLEQDLDNTDPEPRGVHALPDGDSNFWLTPRLISMTSRRCCRSISAFSPGPRWW